MTEITYDQNEDTKNVYVAKNVSHEEYSERPFLKLDIYIFGGETRCLF